MTEASPSAYVIDRVFAQELSFQSVAGSVEMPHMFKVAYAWDWEPQDVDTFYVLFGVQGSPGKDRPERVTVSMAALFRRQGNPQKPAFVDFVMMNGPTILMPYLREAFSNLTGRGLLHAHVLPPVNMVRLMKTFDFNSSAGALKLVNRSDLGTAYGIAPEMMAQIASAAQQTIETIPGGES